MLAVTGTDVSGASEWRIDDEVSHLRVWGSDTVYPLPEGAGEWIVGSGEGCWLRLSDPARRVSRQHARLVRQDGRWGLKDLRSRNGLREDGARRDAILLAPGQEIGIGGVTLIAESPRLSALREVLARWLGWSESARASVDFALRAVRMAATRGETLWLSGEGDLVAIARRLHRHAFGASRPFVVCDPRRRRVDCNARSATNVEEGLAALTAAAGGTLCVWQNRPPEGFEEVVAAIRGRRVRSQLVVCSHALMSGASLVASPIVIPRLAGRGDELDRVIDEYVAEAASELTGELSAVDRAWLRANEATTLPEIEIATRRLVALRGAGGSVARAAKRLEMSRAALVEWVARRGLLAMTSGD